MLLADVLHQITKLLSCVAITCVPRTQYIVQHGVKTGPQNFNEDGVMLSRHGYAFHDRQRSARPGHACERGKIGLKALGMLVPSFD